MQLIYNDVSGLDMSPLMSAFYMCLCIVVLLQGSIQELIWHPTLSSGEKKQKKH